MANPVLLHLPLRNDLNGRDRNGVVTATASGPVRFTADGYYAEEATTNYILNPGFEVNAANTLVANGATITRVTTDQYSGSACGQVVTPGVVNNEGIQWPTGSSIGIAAGQSMIAHARVKAPSGAKMQYWLRLTLDDASVSDTIITTFTGTGSWQPIVTPSVVVPVGRTINIAYLMVRTDSVSAGAAPQAITFFVDNGQIEPKAYATSFCHGSLGTGYSWAGTAHASASNRARSGLTFDPVGRIPLDRGEVHVRVTYGNQSSVGASQYALQHFGTNSRLYIQRLTATKKLSVGVATEGNFAQESGTTPDDTPVVQGVSWDGANGRLYKNFAQAGIGSVGPLTVLAATAYVGGASDNTTINGSISDLMIFDRPLTNAERATLAATPEWHFGVLQPKIGNVLRVGMGVGVA